MRDLGITATLIGYYRSKQFTDIDEPYAEAPTHKYADVIAKLKRIDNHAKALRKHEGYVPGQVEYLMAVNHTIINTFRTCIAEVEADRDRFRGSWV